MLGKFPRGDGHMLEDEEIGHVGVLEQADSATEFGFRVACRFESLKVFVK